MNTALISALAGREWIEVRQDPAARGRMVESAVGAHLLASAPEQEMRLSFWLENRREVDFVMEKGGRLAAIEVKTGRVRDGLPGMEAFLKRHPGARAYLIGGEGIKLEEFFSAPASDLV